MPKDFCMEKNKTICAIVVTYNRKNMLIDCLDHLLRQTYPINSIYIIDNSSCDGTPQLLKEKGFIKNVPEISGRIDEEIHAVTMCSEGNEDRKVDIHYVRMDSNTGGAGGFYEGVKRAYEAGHGWFWLMDDDTICQSDALAELSAALPILRNEKVGMLSSKILYTDGSENIMNVPEFIFNKPGFSKYYSQGIIPIKLASFVSLLIKREVVKEIGWPDKDYFLWGDDMEYCYRISSKYAGFFIDKSVVIHKTKTNRVLLHAAGDRFFYAVRNELWLMKSKYINIKDRFTCLYRLMRNITHYLSKDFSLRKIYIIMKGFWRGIFSLK